MCIVGTACQAPGTGPPTAPVKTEQPADVECPSGKPAHSGLANFGAYIGTWDADHPRDPNDSAAYRLGIVSGDVELRCSAGGYVVSETMRPLFDSPEGQALRMALTDLPDDSTKVYDHRHAGCRVLQYESAKLARQLGADDVDGRVDVVFTSDTGTYTGVVKTILLDLFDRLGADTRAC
jgi:hypothetical protein